MSCGRPGAGTGSGAPQKGQFFSYNPRVETGRGAACEGRDILVTRPIEANRPTRAPWRAGTVLALASLLLGSGAAWAADPSVGEAPVPHAPSAKRMVIDRNMALVSAFARYLEQQMGFKATTPLGHSVTLELAPRMNPQGPPELVALSRPLMAADGPGPAIQTRLSTVVSATPERVRLTLRLRW